MKRYMPAIRLGSEANDDRAEMVEVRTGDYIRHDDPSLMVMVDALTAIALNTCCDSCQEAALVARKALAAVAGTTRGRA